MKYMSDLAAELAEVDARDRHLQRQSAPVPLQDRVAASAAAILLAEVMQSASLVVIVTSLLNALERGTAPPASLAAIRTFMPRRSTLFDTALARLAAEPSSTIAVQRMQQYCHAFDLAVRFADPEILAGDGTTAAASPVDVAADAWRSLCASSRTVATTLADLARSEAVAGRSSGLRTLRHLADAANGKCPALDKSGRLLLPDWAERRRAPRHLADEPAALGWRGALHEARILDVSETGVRVRTAISARQGDRITLARQDGATRKAIVRWAADGCLGLEYATSATGPVPHGRFLP